MSSRDPGRGGGRTSHRSGRGGGGGRGRGSTRANTRRPRAQQQLCRNYNTPGGCRFGEGCRYLHVDGGRSSDAAKDSVGPWEHAYAAPSTVYGSAASSTGVPAPFDRSRVVGSGGWNPPPPPPPSMDAPPTPSMSAFGASTATEGGVGGLTQDDSASELALLGSLLNELDFDEPAVKDADERHFDASEERNGGNHVGVNGGKGTVVTPSPRSSASVPQTAANARSEPAVMREKADGGGEGEGALHDALALLASMGFGDVEKARGAYLDAGGDLDLTVAMLLSPSTTTATAPAAPPTSNGVAESEHSQQSLPLQAQPMKKKKNKPRRARTSPTVKVEEAETGGISPRGGSVDADDVASAAERLYKKRDDAVADLRRNRDDRTLSRVFRTWRDLAASNAAARKAERLAAAEDAAQRGQEERERAQREERERFARMREEAKRNAAAKREKKKERRAKKYQQKVEDERKEEGTRVEFWMQRRVGHERETVRLIMELAVAELVRKSWKGFVGGVSAQKIKQDNDAMDILKGLARKAYREMFRDDVPYRVVVTVVSASSAGSADRRRGKIQFWDEERKEFCVELDTKKGRQADLRYFPPSQLEEDSQPSQYVKKGGGGGSSSPIYHMRFEGLVSHGGGILNLDFELHRDYVEEVRSGPDLDTALMAYTTKRNQIDRIRELQEEEERKKDEEDRRRRAEKKKQENEEWESRKERMRQEREEFAEWRREYRRERQRDGQRPYSHRQEGEEFGGFRGGLPGFMGGFARGGGDSGCSCPQCEFRRRFNSRKPDFDDIFGSFFFRFAFDEGDDEDYGDNDEDDDNFFAGFDRAWEEREAQRKEEENREHARVLGVSVDADMQEIKQTYRKLARQYHPDKWSSSSNHGLSKDDSEEHFKKVQNAYDHLMSNFDVD